MASYQEVNERAELLKDATLGIKIASSLMNVCGHLQFLQNKGFYTQEHREFLDRAVLKFPGTAPLAENYFLNTCDLANLGVTFAATPTGPAVRFAEPAATVISEDNVTVKIEEPSTTVDEAIQVEEPVAVTNAEIEETSATVVSDVTIKEEVDDTTTTRPTTAETVAPVIEDTLTPAIEDTLNPVIEDTLAPIVEDTLAPVAPVAPIREVVTEPTNVEETVTDAFDDVPDSAVIAIRNKGCELYRSMWAPANCKSRSETAESARNKFAQTCAQRGIKIQSPETPKEVVRLSELSMGNEKEVVLPVSEPSKHNQTGEAPLGVMVKYVTERNTLSTDGKVEFQSKALTKGAPPKYVTSRHNSGVIVRAIFDVAGGITGGGPRGDMKWLAFKKGDELSIKKMLGNGWYLARKIKGDAECSTVRISFMEIGANIAAKSTLIGDTSKSPSRIICRTPSPDQDLTYVPPHLRPANPHAAKIEVKNEPIIRKRFEEICYMDGKPSRIVKESITAVIY